MSGYQRLTPKDRYQIEFLTSKGTSQADIARELGVARSTVSRELRHNLGFYRSELAIRSAKARSLKRSDANRKVKGSAKQYVDQLISEDWSPEQVVNTLKVEKEFRISLSTIYRYIERDKLLGGRLKTHLRILRIQRKDRKKSTYRADQSLVRDRRFISERPKIVDTRSRIGDYERDTVRGVRGGRVLLTIVERKTRHVHVACLENGSAELVHQATLRLLKNRVVKTITNDNGAEFAFHTKTSKALKVPIYFSRAYRAWERGTNENTNGLLRQYFPKQKPIPNLTFRQLQEIIDKLNKRPRKILGFKTPYELYEGKPVDHVLR